MDLPGLHVAAACAALALGAAVLARRKGDTLHVVLGRLYLCVIAAVNFPVLFVYDTNGRLGPFHVLAVVSLITTGLGWRSLRRRRGGGVPAHASFMAWSWIGVVTAGLAQLANHQLPQRAPWPVALVVAITTVSGLVLVPRYVASHLRVARRAAAAPAASARPVSCGR